MKDEIAQLRAEYQAPPLLESDLDENPLVEFQRWFALAIEKEPFEANAMTLATCDLQGRPSARVVLLKELDEAGFVFFSNYESHKGKELSDNPQASLLFHWPSQHRQVRIEGRVERLSGEASDAYFASRPRGAQVGAWVSLQSQPVESRDLLQQRRAQLEEKFGQQPIERPRNWGGYRLLPEQMEFWQGQPDRLHDRLHYVRQPTGGWKRQRLMP